jgi:hypothetical protein
MAKGELPSVDDDKDQDPRQTGSGGFQPYRGSRSLGLTDAWSGFALRSGWASLWLPEVFARLVDVAPLDM